MPLMLNVSGIRIIMSLRGTKQSHGSVTTLYSMRLLRSSQ